MKKPNFRLGVICLGLGILTLFNTSLQADSYTWKEPVDGAWDNEEMWDPPGIPGADDDVAFPDPGTGFDVTVGGSVVVNSVHNGGAILVINGSLSIIDKLNWELGGFIGDGKLELKPGCETIIAGPPLDNEFILLTTKTINNHGIVNWVQGNVAGGEGATLNNFGLILVSGEVDLTWPGATENATLHNHAGARFVVGSEVSTDNWIIVNDGNIDILPLSHLLLGLGGTRKAIFNHNSRITGFGELQLHIYATINGDAYLDGNLSLGANGAIEGPGTFHVNNGARLIARGGLLNSPLGTRARTVIEPGGVMEIVDGVDMNVRLLENKGLIEWTGGHIAASEEAIIENHAQFNIKSDLAMTWLSASSNSILRNLKTGIILKTESTNETTLEHFHLENSGAIHVASGSLVLANGIHSFASGTTVAGPGKLVLTNEATLKILEDVTLGMLMNPAYFELAGGTITGPGTLSSFINSTFDWVSGEFVGPGKTVMMPASRFRITGDDPKTLTDGYILENSANAIWTGKGDMHIMESATFINKGMLRLQSDVSFNLPGVVDRFGLFDNREQGFLIKELSAGTSFFDGVPLTNAGTIKVDSGTLDVGANLLNYANEMMLDGRYVVSNILRIDAVNIRTNAATIVMAGPKAQILDQDGTNGLAEFFLNTERANFTVESGYVYEMNRTLLNYGEVFVGPQSSLNILAPGIYEHVKGTNYLNEGVMKASRLLYREGELSGDGKVVGDVVTHGSIRPGDLYELTPAGVLTIEGDLEQTTSGVIQLGVGGAIPGLSMDQLRVTGDVELAGTLLASITHEYSPNKGEEFPVLLYGTRNGQFAHLQGADIGNEHYFEPIYSEKEMLLKVNAQPAGTRFAAARIANGKLVLSIESSGDFQYELQASSDLVNWRMLQTNIRPPATVELPIEATIPGEFYRLVQIP